MEIQGPQSLTRLTEPTFPRFIFRAASAKRWLGIFSVLLLFGNPLAVRSQSIPGVGNRIDPELTSPMTDEITFGVDHELFDNILVSVTGIFRGRTNDVGTVDIGRPFGDMLTNDRCIAECTLMPPGTP